MNKIDMNKKGNIFWLTVWRVMAHSALMLYFFSGFLHGMTTGEYTISRQIEAARKIAEQDAIKMGKTELEVRDAGRAAAIQEAPKAQAEWTEQQACKRNSSSLACKKAGANSKALAQKQDKKDEEKEQESPTLIQAPVVPVQAPVVPEKQEQLAESREERNWAARYEDQTEQSFRVPARFDNKPVLHFGDYRVAWDEEHRRNRVLLCEDDPRSCTLETEDTIYIYELQGDYWVMSNSLDK